MHDASLPNGGLLDEGECRSSAQGIAVGYEYPTASDICIPNWRVAFSVKESRGTAPKHSIGDISKPPEYGYS